MFRYIGSKAATAHSIQRLVGGFRNIKTVADAYGGLGTIGSVMKSAGYAVESCDVLAFPHAFQVARIECNVQPRFRRLKQELNIDSAEALADLLSSARGRDSWFVHEYCSLRSFFTAENGEIIAGAWRLMREWNDAGLLSRLERGYLVASFLNSMDAVANTAGTYYAYLKSAHRKALRPFRFTWMPITSGNSDCRAWHGDALETLQGKNFDVLYLDPPYNKRNYAHYYHLPETLAHLAEREVTPGSQAGSPVAAHQGAESVRRGTDLDYIESLIDNVRWRYLIVHYCANAYIPLPTLRAALRRHGSVAEHRVNALGYTTTNSERKTKHHVFVVTH